MADRPYSRIYHEVVDDPKFASIYGSDRNFATWIRLLILADSTYPSSAPIPKGTSSIALRALASSGLVVLDSHGRFRVKGLEAERTLRSDAARNAAAVRWHSNGNAQPMPRRDETSKDKTSIVTGIQKTCPKDPKHNTILADGKVWCMVDHEVLA